MSDIKDTKSFSINDILRWKDNNELIISPKYQRNKVWNLNAKSYLIDSIIRGYPIPQIFIRQRIDIATRQTIREVIDGQQRITAIIEFVEDIFKVQKTHNKDYGGQTYSSLPDDIKENILNYNISFEIIKIKDDARIYEMFARLNTNNMALNKQELRNAQFWGEFKVFVIQKTALFRDIFIDKKIFKDKDFSRMSDVDFMNSLIIHLIEGINTDSAAKTDSYYRKYDTNFEDYETIDKKINILFEIIDKLFYDHLFTNKIFFRKNYFYTLFCALNHQLFNSLDSDIFRNPKFNIDQISSNMNLLISKLSLLESDLTDLENGNENSKPNIVEFEKNHRTRTTSKDERKRRISILCDYLKD